MKDKRILVTQAGLEKAKADLEAKLKKKDELNVLLNKTVESGDLSENDAYTLALEDVLNIEAEIAKLKDIVALAKVVKGKVKGKVELGDTIIIKDENGNEKKLSVVGENEANPLEGKISYKSPLGAAIIGKTQGDRFDFQTPKAKVKYTLVKVLDR